MNKSERQKRIMKPGTPDLMSQNSDEIDFDKFIKSRDKKERKSLIMVNPNVRTSFQSKKQSMKEDSRNKKISGKGKSPIGQSIMT